MMTSMLHIATKHHIPTKCLFHLLFFRIEYKAVEDAEHLVTYDQEIRWNARDCH